MGVLAIANVNGLKIKTYPVSDWVSVPEGTFTNGVAKNAVKPLIELCHTTSNRLRGRYKRIPTSLER